MLIKTIAHSRWYRLIPVVFITYSLAFLDRANFGFGAAGGMAKDLNLSPKMSSLMGSLFFFGYFLFQVPGTIYASRRSARKLIFWSLIFWGLCAMATGIIADIRILLIIRFLLGTFESAVLPAAILLLSRWFTRNERSRSNTLLMIGNPITVLWMSIVSGYLIHAVGWRGMFIWEGVPAIIWAFFWWNLVQDRPEEASWLDQSEKDQLKNALQKEQQGIKPVSNYLAAFKSRPVVLLCILYVMWSFGVYGFVIWLPSILHAAPGIGIVKTGWLAAVPYFMAIIAMIISSYFSDRMLKRKIFLWPALLIAAFAFYFTYLIGAGHFWPSFILLCIGGMAMYAPYGPFFAIITELLPTNVASVSMALINSFGALGAFGGSYLVGYLNSSTGKFETSYILIALSFALSAALTAFFIRENKPEK
jgi:sugar phosphate permease